MRHYARHTDLDCAIGVEPGPFTRCRLRSKVSVLKYSAHRVGYAFLLQVNRRDSLNGSHHRFPAPSQSCPLAHADGSVGRPIARRSHLGSAGLPLGATSDRRDSRSHDRNRGVDRVAGRPGRAERTARETVDISQGVCRRIQKHIVDDRDAFEAIPLPRPSRSDATGRWLDEGRAR
jgi:hypothetical protein